MAAARPLPAYTYTVADDMKVKEHSRIYERRRNDKINVTVEYGKDGSEKWRIAPNNSSDSKVLESMQEIAQAMEALTNNPTIFSYTKSGTLLSITNTATNKYFELCDSFLPFDAPGKHYESDFVSELKALLNSMVSNMHLGNIIRFTVSGKSLLFQLPGEKIHLNTEGVGPIVHEPTPG